MTEDADDVVPSLWDILAQVPDPREPSGRRFPLQGLLALTLAALLAQRQGLAAIARWGRECTPAQLHRLGIPRERGPCHATYHNVFKALSCERLEHVLAAWVANGLPPDAAIALDGKSLRASRHADYPALHLLAAYCDAVAGVVGQMPVEGKQNEITAAVALLRTLPVKGRVVTGDAMFAQKSVCRAVREAGGDYLVTVKDNQPGLREAITTAFTPALSPLGGATTRRRRNERPDGGKRTRTKGGTHAGGHGAGE